MPFAASIAYLTALAAFSILVAGVLFPLVLIRSLWSHSATTVMQTITVWGDRICRLVCRIMRITMTFRLAEERPLPPCIVIANHQSTMDVIVLLAFFRSIGLTDTRWVAKREAGGFPFIGYLAHKSGAIFVNRSKDPDDVNRVREGALRAKLDEASVFLFPEGTRFAGKGPIPHSGYRHVLPPKQGGFRNLQEILPDYPVLSVTLCWHPPVGERGDAKTIFQSAAYFGKAVSVNARLVSAREADDPNWLNNEWRRKDALLSLPL